MRRTGTLVALVVATLVAAGCGGQGKADRPSQPTGTPRAALLAFYDDVLAGRYAAACARLHPSVAETNVAREAKADLRIPAGTHAARMRYIRETHAAIRTCPDGLRRLMLDHPDGVRKARARAAKARQTKPFPIAQWEFGNNDWTVIWVEGRWTILTGSVL